MEGRLIGSTLFSPCTASKEKHFLSRKQQRFFSPEAHSTRKQPNVICLKLNFEQKTPKKPKKLKKT
jgi:hypothetical protein